MKAWRLHAGRTASHACGALRRIANAPRASRTLMYHAIGSPIPEDRSGLYTLSPEIFERQVHALTAMRARIPIMNFEAAAFAEQAIAITFDDGYRDTLLVAAPMLCAAGLPFTVFVSSGYIGSGDPLYLSPAELRQLAGLPGVTIGSHGAKHIRLTECTDDALRTELSGSKDMLETILGCPVTSLSYPHGAVDERVRAAAVDTGYLHAACSRFGPNNRQSDPMLLRRVDIWSCDRMSDFHAKLAGDWDWLAWRR